LGAVLIADFQLAPVLLMFALGFEVVDKTVFMCRGTVPDNNLFIHSTLPYITDLYLFHHQRTGFTHMADSTQRILIEILKILNESDPPLGAQDNCR